MACKDCLNNCDPIVYDKCVQYTGDDVPLLGICNGDSLYEVESLIFEKLTSALDGTGITLSDLTLDECPELKTVLGSKEPTLLNIVQILWDNQCSLKELISEESSTPFAFNVSCLTGLPTNPSSDQILQAALNQLCSLKSTVDSFSSTYVKIDDLETLVNQIIAPTDTPSTVIQYNTRMVPYSAMAYFGPLSNFDNTGKGISSAGFDKVYICNGLNGTPDGRGRTFVGAVRNVPGGTLDAAVNPTNANNIQPVDYSTGDKFGENFHKNTIAETPAHTHNVTDPGHKHSLPSTIQYFKEEQPGPTGGGESGSDDRVGPRINRDTQTAFTGITIASAGGGQAHENRQPSLATIWIMYIP